ncbi:tripartite tricarboxylate transporter substrate binding protein [Reyranella aquatilis]|uniref:Tripartite tricarboxylate transporter substrate binding protein n=1 Tax=Reyranella aquatilis TaxID=2035356 RepID=A0ABS8KRX7_9HYPH|nr:tripartite tricarboxylate transporter substrate binding protein [Reyranella aquatilis]MCC8428822.1 tripartite tricarboxylate transporter substrate binding protein [Reyranella aquatilis]
MKRRRLLALGSVAAGSLAANRASRAQGAYPDRPITLVVAAPAGGGTDIVGRMFAEHLSKEFGQQVVVDNKGGGNGNIATALVAKAKPDGYTLLMQYSSFHSANPAMIKNLNWSPKDLTGVAMGAIAPQVIVIAKRVPADNLKDFIAYAKANPGKLNYASFGPGSVAHIGGVLLNKAAGIDLVHIPYKGAGPVSADLVAGQVELAVMSPPSVAAHIRNGNVKALAIANEVRHPAFPEIPTTAEAGLPSFIFDAWYGMFAPAGTPKPIVDKLNAAMRKIAKLDVVIERSTQLGTVLKDWTPEQFDQFVAAEGEVWSKLIRENKITLDE